MHTESTMMNEALVAAGDATLFTESVGDRKSPPVLLIMGAMASGVWWPRSFRAQSAGCGRFVIRYDYRDTGGSTSYGPGGATYSTETLADDVLSVLDGYHVEAAHLVGMSLGGYLAQIVALKAPRRVQTLTLIASELLAPDDLATPPMDPRVPAYHARAAGLNWTNRDAVIDYQVGAWRLLTGSAHPLAGEKSQEWTGKTRQEGYGLRRIAFLAQENPERRVSARNNGASFWVVADALATCEPSLRGQDLGPAGDPAGNCPNLIRHFDSPLLVSCPNGS